MLKYIKQKVDARRLSFWGLVDEHSFIKQHDPEPRTTEQEVMVENWQKQTIDFKYTFNLEGNVINVIFTNVTENKVLFKYSIDFSSFNDLTEQTIYGIIQPWDLQEDIISRKNLTDLSSLTSIDKDVKKYFVGSSIVKFLVEKDSPTSVNDITLLIYEPCDPSEKGVVGGDDSIDMTEYGRHNITVDGTGIDQTSYLKTIETIDECLAEITTTSTTSGDVITVNVSTDPKVSKIYLDSTVGYLPKAVVNLTNGTGSFKVITTGLETGDVVSVKLGFKKWSNRSTFTKTI